MPSKNKISEPQQIDKINRGWLHERGDWNVQIESVEHKIEVLINKKPGHRSFKFGQIL